MTTINPQVESVQGTESLSSLTQHTVSLEELAGVPTAAQIADMAAQFFPELTDSYSDASILFPQPEEAYPQENILFPQSTEGYTNDSFFFPNPETCEERIDKFFNSQPTGYSPAVMSQEEAKANDRRIDVPTSLGGDKVTAEQVTEKRSDGRNDHIVIGSKTLRQIRDDFPILNENINGSSLVWLDNGATTQKPQVVIDRLKYFYEHENSNVHRGAHTLAARSTDAYENARETVRRFIGAQSKDEIVFVRGTTEGINLVANAYVKPTLEPGDEIIVSILEHHANIVPWQLVAQETGALLKVIPCDKDGQLILSEYEKLFTARTKFVSVTHVSNTLGTVTPVEEIIAIAHRHGVRILVDGAQSVAHIPVNVSALDADFFVFSGHKIFAPTGIGAVYGKKELLEAARPYHGGGNMIKDVTFERTVYNPAPNKFEAGTGSIADAVGLGAALEYLEKIGMPSVNQWEHELLTYALSELKKVHGLHLVGTAANKASALAFKLDGYSDEEVGERLDRYGIAVRVGHHCAQPVLRHFGYESVVRPTIALYNSPDDIDALVKVLKTFA
ncbi:MAG: cysteine desulfurase [Lachnospiraceae bacterium]|nr:cysteine desulfurase [Lachnospiraceae bacterium]